MKNHNLILTNLFAALTFLISIPIQAGILFDSTAHSVFNVDPIFTGTKISASFITKDQPIRLTTLTVRWQKDPEQAGNIHVLLLEDKNEYPGSVLENLATVDTKTLALGEQWLTVPFKNTKELAANTRYWIEISATGSPGSIAYSREKVGDGIATEYYLNKYGLRRNTQTGPYIFKLEGIEN